MSQKFAFEQRGTVISSLDYSRIPCFSGEIFQWNNYGWLHSLVLALCTVHLILIVKYINDIGKRYR
jgi:hypothetical protein